MTTRNLIALLIGPALLLVVAIGISIFENDLQGKLTYRIGQIKELRESANTLMGRVAPSPDKERLTESFIAISQASDIFATSVLEILLAIRNILVGLALIQIFVILWVRGRMKPYPASAQRER